VNILLYGMVFIVSGIPALAVNQARHNPDPTVNSNRS
jgi:hypothetical protein